MVALTFKIEGLAEVAEGLNELPKATGTNVLKRALKEAADPIATAAKQKAPRLSGALQVSIKPSDKLSRRQKSLYHKESEVEIFVGPSALVQAITQEFGTVTNRPQPFLRPAWQEHKHEALESIKDVLAEEIEKARARIARKTARLAAKAATGG
jgi:HK97 gp10 family phage protein